MAVIRTVRGDIEPRALGITLCHEHLVLSASREQTLTGDDVLDDLWAYADRGGKAVVELTNTGMGRDVRSLRVLAEATGLHIVCGTGFYKQSHYPPVVHAASLDELMEGFVREIKEGIEETGIRAGVIGEIGTSQDRITPDEEKVLRAAARAALATGASVSTHTSFGHFALEQLTILQNEGLPSDRISIGHLDLLPDPDYHAAVAKQGAYVQYDTFGKEQYQSDSARLLCLIEMIRRGFERKILLSCDITRRSYLRKNGGWGYAYLLIDVVERLRASGLQDDVLDHLLVANPMAFLSLAA
jgi:phosphotriesterase-related protein